ncbi:c-type cytochrome [Helicobacter muridarum]|uniref:C-type cytochrome n=1 Tax=Helicobacter muridarum TaxID=216 RepID=A0A099TY14_9HELI|nr:c-type cytochrome [Helicobacter muridarum]TLE00479.1 c-type cytochrome [Helicobacter muridarum]STQ86455.1 cytochrome C553 (soluble cytochrome f) [Helicobacter muridarum]
MLKFSYIIAAGLFVFGLGNVSLANSDAAAIVAKQCKACHGAKMEKSYLNKTAVVNTLSSEEIKKDLLEYKAGTLNRYGQGKIMTGQVKKLSDEDIEALAKYIPTLK